MITKIINGKIITDDDIITEKSLYFENNKITNITNESLKYDNVIDAKGNYVSAGFIDMHTHGGGGFDFMDGGTEPIIKAVLMHLKHGATSIMPTTLACSTKVLIDFLTDLNEAKKECPSIIGAHLEGPYFSKEQSGAQNPEYIKTPDKAEYIKIIQFGKEIIKRWSFAPELESSNEFCTDLVENDIIPSIAHSNAVLEDVEKVYKIGCNLITHLYSGMSTITRQGGFRKLGVVESAYYFDDMNVEIIADGKHLPPELLKLIVKQKNIDKICLVTDSMRGAGMPDGPSFLGRKKEAMPCIIEDGVAKLTDKSAFAGSVATADLLVRTMVKNDIVNIPQAIKMITLNPAKILGLKTKGRIEPGYDADIVIFDDNITISNVILQGDFVF